MAPWKGLTGPFLAVWLLGVGCLVAAAVLLVSDYDRFNWPPIIPALTMTSVVLNLVAVRSRRKASTVD